MLKRKVTGYDIDPVARRNQFRLGQGGFVGSIAPTGGGIQNSIRSIVNGFNLPQSAGSTGHVPSMNNNGAGRPVGSLMPATRSEGVQKLLTPQFTLRSQNQAKSNQSLTDWTREFLQNRPRAKRFANEEMASVGRVYGSGDGSLEGDLAGVRKSKATAIRDLTEAAMRRAGRADSLRRMTGGNNSYFDRLRSQDMMNIAASTAASNSDQEREDMIYLDQARRGSVGTRRSILDSLINSELLPGQVSNAMESDDLNRLNQLAGIEYGNNDYIPSEDAYSRRLNFLNYLSQFDV